MRFRNPKNITAICLSSFFAVLLILILDSFTLNYWVKSAVKLVAWGSAVVFACKPHPTSIFKTQWHKSFFITLALSVLSLIVVYFMTPLVISWLDLEQAQTHLSNIGVAKDYLYVSAYIVLVNSTLEEVFFRGMCMLKLHENSNRIFAIMYSSFLFAIYHVPMMAQILPVFLTVLCFVALFFVGIIFAMLNSKTKNIYNAWILHACTNIAIQYCGYMILHT